MRKLLVYLKDYKKEAILAPLFKMLEASFELFVPLVVASMIDVGIENRDINYIFKMGGVLILLALVGLGASITAQYFSAKAAVGFATKLRQGLYKHVQSLSYTELDTMGTSTLITHMTSDVNQLQSGVNMALRLLLRSPFIVFGAMIMAFTVDIKAALIFVVVIPLLSVVVFGIMLYTMPLYKNVQRGLNKILARTRENLEGVRVIRAFCKENDEVAAFSEDNKSLFNLQVFVGKISAAMNPVTYIIINAGLIAVLWTGAVRVDIGVISQGEVVALVNYMSQILVELIKLANLIIQLTKAVACGNRVATIFDIKNSQIWGDKDGKDEPQFEIEFENVSLKYMGAGEESLSDITFKVKKGQTLGIIGGTGSGKTSLVNMIPRFYDSSNGRVLVKGVDVKEYKESNLRKLIGIVPQKAVLFHGTIRENLLWGNEKATDEEIFKVLEKAQALDFVNEKEGGLNYEIAQGGKNLSGGQKQRLTIARALIKNPEILILDDSASALDYATDAKLRAAIKNISNEITVCIVSQRTSSIMNADKILVLDDGKLVGLGTHKELLESNEVYQEIYYSQFPKEENKEA